MKYAIIGDIHGNLEAFEVVLKDAKEQKCTHYCCVGDVMRGSTYSKFRVEPDRKYFVNVGSVGQPRDGNPKAAYVIYDLEEGSIALRRLDYDIPSAQKKIIEAGLPPALAEGLASGTGDTPLCGDPARHDTSARSSWLP